MIERSVAAGYEVDLFCLQAETPLNVNQIYPIHTNVSKWKWRRKLAAVLIGVGSYLLRTKRQREWLIQLAYGLESHSKPFNRANYDLLIVEDLFLLPYCLKHANGTPIIFDAREFYPKQREGEFLFEILERPIRNWLCKTYLQKCQKVFTVSIGLAKAYKNQYQINTTLLRSTPNYIEPTPSQKRVDGGSIRLVHLGGANPNRQIEKMIEVFRELDARFTFDLYLSGNNSYITKIKRIADTVKRVTIKDPVAPDRIINTLSLYDIGFYYLEPNGFNLKHCLPNKFFEFIQARLAIAIGPSPDMRHLIDEFQCGFVAEKFTINSMVKTLNNLTDSDIKKAKKCSDTAAKSLCAEREWIKLDKALTEYKIQTLPSAPTHNTTT